MIPHLLEMSFPTSMFSASISSPPPKRRKIDVSANEVDEDTVLENEAPGEGPDNDDPPLVPSNDAMGRFV